jgi:hypothetical protein
MHVMHEWAYSPQLQAISLEQKAAIGRWQSQVQHMLGLPDVYRQRQRIDQDMRRAVGVARLAEVNAMAPGIFFIPAGRSSVSDRNARDAADHRAQTTKCARGFFDLAKRFRSRQRDAVQQNLPGIARRLQPALGEGTDRRWRLFDCES